MQVGEETFPGPTTANHRVLFRKSAQHLVTETPRLSHPYPAFYPLSFYVRLSLSFSSLPETARLDRDSLRDIYIFRMLGKSLECHEVPIPIVFPFARLSSETDTKQTKTNYSHRPLAKNLTITSA